MTRSLIATATLAALLCVGTSPAVARANETGLRSVAVYTADLDIGTAKDQRRLRQRVARTARDVCGMNVQVPGTTLPTAQARRCYFDNLRKVDRHIAQGAERRAQFASSRRD
ncbi:UrcA family protein [Aurantiacibacter spongiae]|uniref:UrcA family protein n=1 Tax=Aurantiacibacter spongiae TaxID=2488860 RepID=A0A3N5CPR0_9SPHN|nr:UrcA family protein [Aurantiacibacter spongiae]RPF70567.1 UrcA family protein [Aurantiacibacter spongiae]